MSAGHLVSIHIARVESTPTEALDRVRVAPGCGLEGDRNYRPDGVDAPDYRAKNEATFIEMEALEALERDYGIPLSPGESRRNLVTRGIPLNHLVGKRFRVGPALFEGIELCEPCAHLEKLTRKGVRKGLVHRGGLRARIVEGGEVSVGDAVEAAD